MRLQHVITGRGRSRRGEVGRVINRRRDRAAGELNV